NDIRITNIGEYRCHEEREMLDVESVKNVLRIDFRVIAVGVRRYEHLDVVGLFRVLDLPLEVDDHISQAFIDIPIVISDKSSNNDGRTHRCEACDIHVSFLLDRCQRTLRCNGRTTLPYVYAPILDELGSTSPWTSCRI